MCQVCLVGYVTFTVYTIGIVLCEWGKGAIGLLAIGLFHIWVLSLVHEYRFLSDFMK